MWVQNVGIHSTDLMVTLINGRINGNYILICSTIKHNSSAWRSRGVPPGAQSKSRTLRLIATAIPCLTLIFTFISKN
jgi:heme/copper-type cytochrome/quinol oxidase subunit 2